ncbi:hypothetical protein CIL03_18170 [Virgibacillus indicus]|uniref:CXXC-20-CXXC protein n=1 Tax=Virgibacillus indicus TaxID=2024554 RepID=A0A265N507_9BACI|nr:TIGR04104 family putative zinc finger protein [Virgibacillus indicus]OZU87113.1 hypothetical protein CIL03_18170 [Virgibacillus indicus]
MPTCQNCSHIWTWKETVKKSFTLDTGMNCPNCWKKQYVTSRSRKKTAMFSFLAPALLLMNLFFGSSVVILILLIASIPFFFGIYPFFLELSNEEEALW